jgi:hypothetical protein
MNGVLLPLLLQPILLSTSQQLQMARLGRETALCLRNEAGSEFLAKGG